MIRKISTKALFPDDKNKKGEGKLSQNQYYLPQPQPKHLKTVAKEMEVEAEKDKHFLKIPRKCSHNPPLRTFSIAQLKHDLPNQSKELQAQKSVQSRKIETRKFRSSSNCQTPKRNNSKSSIKLQLATRKDSSRRINLKIETPSNKKPQQKINLKQMNFDSYYNNDGMHTESKTIRGKRPSSQHSSSSSQLKTVLQRCKRVIEDYQQQLQAVKKQNSCLVDENRRLRQQKERFI